MSVSHVVRSDMAYKEPSFISSAARVPQSVIFEIIDKCVDKGHYKVTELDGSLGERGIYVDHVILDNWARYLFCTPSGAAYDLQGGCLFIVEALGIEWRPPQSKPQPELKGAVDVSANPAHYANFDVSPVDLIGSYKLDFFSGNVIKYVARAGFKNGRGDLLKALWYLLWLLGLGKDEIEKTVKEVEARG